MKKGVLILFTGLLLSFTLNAQQLPLYSQYLFNKYLINPAVAGSDGYTSFNLTAREQWLGYSGAPRTYSFSYQARLLKRSYILRNTSARKRIFRPKSEGKVGLGGYVFSDKNGLIQRTGIQTTYAYHTWLYGETQLSFGLSATAFHLKINEDQIAFEDPDDPILFSDLRKGVLVPDANFGVYLLNYRYNIGFSVEQLFQSFAKVGNPGFDNLTFMRHFYLFGSYTYPISPESEIQPNFMFRMSEQLKPQLDFGVNYFFKQDLWGGLSYRTGNALIASLGVRFDQFYFGYAFDFSFSEIQSVTYGSHELMLAMKLGSSSRKYRWLDRY
ncbi:MAG: type IX secretion system membrane protein PorP/SprF [Marinilabiliaceae bacterium]|jgi:type IX secretion system PorP/SprF family membrane protein|nr:type IX secretion system membrane protein PorP/SprF [Marinilabiliaceae bacterium]